MFTITINTENDAFQDNKNAEIARILRDLAERIEAREIPVRLMDINGNACGTVTVE